MNGTLQDGRASACERHRADDEREHEHHGFLGRQPQRERHVDEHRYDRDSWNGEADRRKRGAQREVETGLHLIGISGAYGRPGFRQQYQQRDGDTDDSRRKPRSIDRRLDRRRERFGQSDHGNEGNQQQREAQHGYENRRRHRVRILASAVDRHEVIPMPHRLHEHEYGIEHQRCGAGECELSGRQRRP